MRQKLTPQSVGTGR